MVRYSTIWYAVPCVPNPFCAYVSVRYGTLSLKSVPRTEAYQWGGGYYER